MYYSPVRHSSSEEDSFDLHVLGTPPAFILSQDQTLHCLFIFTIFRLFSSSFSLLSVSGSFFDVCFLILFSFQ